MDRPASRDPLPLIIRSTDQSLFAVGEEGQLVNLFRLDTKNRQVLPRQRIENNIIEHWTSDRDHEWFLANSCENIFAVDFAEGYCSQRMFTGGGLSRILRGESTQRDRKLRLIQSIFRQIGCHICDEVR